MPSFQSLSKSFHNHSSFMLSQRVPLCSLASKESFLILLQCIHFRSTTPQLNPRMLSISVKSFLWCREDCSRKYANYVSLLPYRCSNGIFGVFSKKLSSETKFPASFQKGQWKHEVKIIDDKRVVSSSCK